jgi:drug/metabolite transporter (DMT)-like permease
MIKNQPENQDFSLIAAIYTVFLCILFGSNAVAIKMAFNGIGVFTTAAIRFSIASITIYLWARTAGQSLILKKGQLHQMLILSILFWAQISLFYLGLSKTNASRGTLIANLLPFFILFLAHIFIPGDRITKRKLVGILLGFAGVTSMFLEDKNITSDLRLGDLIILLAVFFWASNAIYLKRIIDAYNSFQIVLYSMLFAVPFFFLEGFLSDRHMVSHLDSKIIGALLYQSFVTASFGFVAWNNLFHKHGAVSLHSFVFIMPIAGVALGGLVLGEPITPKLLLALVLIVSGILVVHWKAKREASAYPIRRGI